MNDGVALAIAFLGLLLVGLVLRDAFETIVLPGRPARAWLGFTPGLYRLTWPRWAWIARRLPRADWREATLSVFGPLSILVILGVWAAGLVFGLAALQWGLGVELSDDLPGRVGFGEYLYLSGTTFFTLGFGDIVPQSAIGRFIAIVESGTGFAFLALVIGYLPVLYQAFSRREVTILVVYSRAGTPPTAGSLLVRYAAAERGEVLDQLLIGWERWTAELLESHLSYPLLGFFRSQHVGHSWVGALTIVLDASAVLAAAGTGAQAMIAGETFSMGRQAAVDLCQQFLGTAEPAAIARSSKERFQQLTSTLREAGLPLLTDDAAYDRFDALRLSYEPYLVAIAAYLAMSLPDWWVKDEPASA
jgi:hypothetical protein